MMLGSKVTNLFKRGQTFVVHGASAALLDLGKNYESSTLGGTLEGDWEEAQNQL